MPFTSKAQARLCFALKGQGKGKGWNCETWAHHTPDMKKLPDHKEPEEKTAELLATQTPEERRRAVKAAFLAACAAEGILDPDAIVKQADALVQQEDKVAYPGESLVGAGMEALKTYGDYAGALAIGAPLGAGFGGGYLIGKAHNATEAGDTDALRNASLTQAYQRLAERAKIRQAIGKSQAARDGRVITLA
jgi:hypothetical protein